MYLRPPRQVVWRNILVLLIKILWPAVMCLCSENQLGDLSSDYRTVRVWPPPHVTAHTHSYKMHLRPEKELKLSLKLSTNEDRNDAQRSPECGKKTPTGFNSTCVKLSSTRCCCTLFISVVCLLSAVLQDTAGKPGFEGQAAGDGATAQPKQSGARETPTGLAGLLFLWPLTGHIWLLLMLAINTCGMWTTFSWLISKSPLWVAKDLSGT